MSICVINYHKTNSKYEKLLDFKTDHKLKFYTHIDEMYKKAGQNLNASSRVTPYMDLSKRRMLINAFFWSQFS